MFGDVDASGRLPYTVGKRLSDYGDAGQILTVPNGVIPQQDFDEGLYIDYRHFDKVYALFGLLRPFSNIFVISSTTLHRVMSSVSDFPIFPSLSQISRSPLRNLAQPSPLHAHLLSFHHPSQQPSPHPPLLSSPLASENSKNSSIHTSTPSRRLRRESILIRMGTTLRRNCRRLAEARAETRASGIHTLR